MDIVPLQIPAQLKRTWYAAKVSACARAEDSAMGHYRSCVWIATDCLILQPPVLLSLGDDVDAAVRPVHHRNVGLPENADLDPFWAHVYAAVGVSDLDMTVQTFVEQESLRAYFNTHAFALRPDKGICRRWLKAFTDLATDDAFQSGPCRDVLHRVFLHQAPFSPLVVTELGTSRIRILPPTYSYPYSLQEQIPESRRITVLNDLASIAYEDRSLVPDAMIDMTVHEPLQSWLLARTP